MRVLPEIITSESELDDLLTEPTKGVVQALADVGVDLDDVAAEPAQVVHRVDAVGGERVDRAVVEAGGCRFPTLDEPP